MTLKRREWKHKLKKLDMMRDKYFGGGMINGKISALSEGVPYENTWFRVGGKLVSKVGTKPRVAKTTKDMKFGVIKRSVKDFLKGKRDIKGGSGHVVYKIDSSDKCMRPKGKGKRSIRKKGKIGFNNMTMMSFGIAIVFRGIGGSGDVRDTLGGKKLCKCLVFTSIIVVKVIF